MATTMILGMRAVHLLDSKKKKFCGVPVEEISTTGDVEFIVQEHTGLSVFAPDEAFCGDWEQCHYIGYAILAMRDSGDDEDFMPMIVFDREVDSVRQQLAKLCEVAGIDWDKVQKQICLFAIWQEDAF